MFKLFPAFSRDADPTSGSSPTNCGPSELISEVFISLDTHGDKLVLRFTSVLFSLSFVGGVV